MQAAQSFLRKRVSLRSILGDENELCAMSDSMAKLAVNDATATIIEKLLEMCGRK